MGEIELALDSLSINLPESKCLYNGTKLELRTLQERIVDTASQFETVNGNTKRTPDVIQLELNEMMKKHSISINTKEELDSSFTMAENIIKTHDLDRNQVNPRSSIIGSCPKVNKHIESSIKKCVENLFENSKGLTPFFNFPKKS